MKILIESVKKETFSYEINQKVSFYFGENVFFHIFLSNWFNEEWVKKKSYFVV